MNDPKKLRRLALVPLLAGAAAIIAGVVWVMFWILDGQEKMAAHQPPDSVPPYGAFLAMGGLLLFGVGVGMHFHANRGRMMRSELKRILGDPVLREAMQDVLPELAAGARVCPRCHAAAVAGAEFCGGCGAPLARCLHCGADRASSSQFCIRCGRPFERTRGGRRPAE
jgi:hypothetical protein